MHYWTEAFERYILLHGQTDPSRARATRTVLVDKDLPLKYEQAKKEIREELGLADFSPYLSVDDARMILSALARVGTPDAARLALRLRREYRGG